jgi:anti-sigma regulatory factor (Ser/Thr protein kinase)
MQTRAFDPPVRADCLATPDCLASLLDLVDRYCVDNGVDGASQHDLHLIVEEACFNVISHAYPSGTPGPLSLQVEARDLDGRPVVEITIQDEGIPFDPLAPPVTARAGPVEEMEPGGLGVLLIRSLSDRQQYRRDAGGRNILTIGKFITAGHGI